MAEPKRCTCGGLPVRFWRGSPKVWRIGCVICDFTTAVQPTEDEAIVLWNEYVSGKRKPTHQGGEHA
jgi:hypothetical protein